MQGVMPVISCFLLAGAAAAQQVTSGPFMVFFDWGKAEVRQEYSEVFDRVVESWRARPSATVMLAGHSDRSGDAIGNRTASIARASAVRSELERRGIPRNVIRIASFGEERPLVPTEDGVREVQNRRVVISLEE